jgi:acyl-coenzyme A synthetase/AMP-(fatty) acid ligase
MRFFINKLDKKSSFEYFEAIGKNIESTKIKIYNNEILVKSDLLFKGYIKSDMYHSRTDEYFKTGDLVIEKNNQLFFYGRTNDEIKIAGNKISLKYIEKQISKVLNDDLIPIVITKKHPVFGNIIVLVCYFKNNIHYSREILIEKIRKVLRPFEIPHFIYKIEQLSYTQTLKIDRKRIANMLDNLEVLK